MVVRRRSSSRSGAWLIAYSLLGGAALAAGVASRRRQAGWPILLAGVPLAAVGYQAGNAVLRHTPSGPPPEELSLELLALAGVVAPAEELTWGGLVEPQLGIPATAMLFAAKHVVVDGRWRRAVGLALFWVGLGLVRRRSPGLALGLHVAANASGVLLGHITGEDSF